MKKISIILFPLIYIPLVAYGNIVFIELFAKGGNAIPSILMVMVLSLNLVLFSLYVYRKIGREDSTYCFIGLGITVVLMAIPFIGFTPSNIRNFLHPSTSMYFTLFYLAFLYLLVGLHKHKAK